MLGYYGSASSDTGMGYELEVIAAAVVGGTVLTGGKGSVLGTLLGALLIKTIDQGIVILKIDQSYSRIIVGSVIILSVALDQYSTQWRRTTAAPKDVGA
jgi:ribose/xylose/arabinose/galactoside ABC-type transport system permease subunit